LYLATGAIGESFEGLHCGVGYTTPFEVLASSALDEHVLTEAMRARDLKGVSFLPFVGRPFYGAQQGEELRGVRLVLTDPSEFQPVRTAMALLIELHAELGEGLRVKSERAFAIRWGSPLLLELVRDGASLVELERSVEAGLTEFTLARSKHLHYGPK
jgi:uncharacterized protein YbbC (DUF1343 family)